MDKLRQERPHTLELIETKADVRFLDLEALVAVAAGLLQIQKDRHVHKGVSVEVPLRNLHSQAIRQLGMSSLLLQCLLGGHALLCPEQPVQLLQPLLTSCPAARKVAVSVSGA